MGTDLRSLCDLDVPVAFDGVLDRHDRVSAVGDDSAGRYRSGRTMRERTRSRMASGDPHRDREHARRVLRPNCVAVHGGARKRWKVDECTSRLGEDPPGGTFEWHGLGCKPPRMLEDAGERLLDCQELAHCVGAQGFDDPVGAFDGAVGCPEVDVLPVSAGFSEVEVAPLSSVVLLSDR